MSAIIQVCAILNISALAILNNILVRLNCDLAGIAACRVAVNCISDRVVACKQRNGKLLVRRPVRLAYDSHPKVSPDVILRRGEGLVRRGWGVLFPDRVQRGGAGHNDGTAGLTLCGRRVPIGAPTEEREALTGRNLRGDRKGVRLLVLGSRLIRLAGRCAGAVVGVIVQRKNRQDGFALEVVVRSVLAVCKKCAGAFASSVAAAASPGNVVDLIVVDAIPDVLGIGKSERIIVDSVLAKVNRDVVAADACNRMAIDLVADPDLHAGDSAVHRRMQHDRAITRRNR